MDLARVIALNFMSGLSRGPDHLDSPLVTSESIVPAIRLQTKLKT